MQRVRATARHGPTASELRRTGIRADHKQRDPALEIRHGRAVVGALDDHGGPRMRRVPVPVAGNRHNGGGDDADHCQGCQHGDAAEGSAATDQALHGLLPVLLLKEAIRQPALLLSSWHTACSWMGPLPCAVSAVALKASWTVAATT